MPRYRPETEIRELCERQHGAFSARQATELGFSRRQIRTRLEGGEWHFVSPRALRFVGTPITPHLLHSAAVLSGGPGTVLSHDSAAWLWLLPVDRGQPAPAPDTPHILLPPQRHHRLPGITVHRHPLSSGEVTVLENLPVTTRDRAILDVCLSPHAREWVVALLDRALQQNWISLDSATGRLLGMRGRPRVSALIGLLGELGAAAADSERRLHEILDNLGIKGWEANARIEREGELIAIADVAFRLQKVLLEVDGMAWHIDRDRFQRDRTRQNQLVLMGWTVLRFTWDDLVRRPHEVGRTILRALASAAA